MKLQRIVVVVTCVVIVGLLGAPLGDDALGIGGSDAIAQQRGDKHKKKRKKTRAAIHRCVDYSQDQDEEGLRLRLANSCAMDLTCSMSWQLICSGDTSDVTRKKAKVFSLGEDTSAGAFASAAVCGDDGWRVSSVRWSCEDEAL